MNLDDYKKRIYLNKIVIRKNMIYCQEIIREIINECEYNENDIEKVSYKLAIKSCDEELESITNMLQNILENLDGTNKDDHKWGMPSKNYKVDE